MTWYREFVLGSSRLLAVMLVPASMLFLGCQQQRRFSDASKTSAGTAASALLGTGDVSRTKLTSPERVTLARGDDAAMETVASEQAVLTGSDIPQRPSPTAFQPGDVVEIRFFYTPQLNITQTVRPDGQITLELIGDVTAQGKTAAELQGELLRHYAGHLKTPEIAVIARSFYNRRVYVGGEVRAPGIADMPGPMTALEAIMQAGGFDMRAAEVENVVVVRYKGTRRYAYALNLKATLKGEATEPFYLEPQDIVYVPRTKIAEINQWIDQHINKIIPDTGIFFRQTNGDTTIGVGTYR